jgi:hypothetical protein
MESYSPWVLNGNIGSGVLYVFVPLQLTKFVSHTLEVKAMNMLNIAIETRNTIVCNSYGFSVRFDTNIVVGAACSML